MNIKIIALLVLICCVSYSFAQTPNAPDPSRTKEQIPTSPEASALGKFGDIPVGLYTGVPNINIPLYVLKIKNFELPIGLSYNSSGIKVEELATTTGLGWTLNPGGAISISVNGLKDDQLGGFISPQLGDDPLPPHVLSPASLAYDYNQSGGGQMYQWAKRVADGIVDTQPDLYYYSFPGGSGKFYFDQQKQAHPIPFSTLKIDYFNQNGIEITDENGRVFSFNASESSLLENNCGLPIFNNTFFLSSIRLPDGNTVNFEYTSVNYNYEVQPSSSRKVLVQWNYAPETLDCTNQMNHTLALNGIRLSRITSSVGHEIKFIYHNNRTDLSGTQSLDSLVISNQNGLINSYAFNYGYFVNSITGGNHRLKLLSVSAMNKGKYSFSYNEAISVPNRLSFAQDHWGYYNGKNNSTLLPVELDYGFFDGGNREVDSAFSQMAILKQITYPTGGYSRFNFEQNDYFFKGNEKTYIPSTYSTYGQDNQTITTSLTIAANQNVVSGSVTFDDGTGSHTGPVGDEPVDPDTKIEITGSNGFYRSYYNSMVQNGKIGIDLIPGVYTITITSNGAAKGAYCRVDYLTVISTYVEKNKLIGGLRIKSIVNRTSEVGSNEIKQYLYSQSSNPERSSGLVNFYPLYTALSARYNYGRRVGILDDSEGVCRDNFQMPNYASYWKQTANSVYPIGSIKGGSVGYTFVTELNGNDIENGKTESTFSFVHNSGGSLSSPLIPFVDNDWLNGLLQKQVQYRNQGGIFQPVSKIQNFYSVQSEAVFWNKHYIPSTYLAEPLLRGRGVNIEYKRNEKICGLTIYPAEFYINDYRYRSEWLRLDSSQTVNYSFLPLLDSVKTINQLIYNNPAHLLANISSTKTSSGLLLNNITNYPQDFLQGFSAAIDSLIAHNRINTVLTQQVNNNSSVSTTNYQYKNWDSKITELEFVQSHTNNNALEDRVQFYNYDDRANPLSSGQSKGVKINYIWSYNKAYPIAEIKNADYSEIVTALGGMISINTFANKPIPTKAEIEAFLSLIRTNNAFEGAQITSFTYDPFVGMLTATDPKGVMTFYEYDNEKRLMNIKDQNGHVVKNYIYHYKP